jgi:hypothetical protein
MSLSSRLLALIAAAAITATSFILPAYAAPVTVAHHIATSSASHS